MGRRLRRCVIASCAIAGCDADHNFVLDESIRSGGTHIGTDVAHFADRLLAHLPITAGIIGASVAQNAGCLTQSGRRCMNYRGIENVTLVHGQPRSRPFKGFLVRWFEWLNATWPHADHQIVNNGRDAQPIWTLLPCLYAYVPPKVDLIFLEVGSMPYAHDPVRAEAVVRRLATLDPRPTIVFVTVTVWCTCHPLCRNFKAYGVSRLPSFKEQLLLNQTERPIPHVEKSVAALCDHYGLSCISMRSALNGAVFAGRPGFSIPEIAGDCLHPTSGTRGVDYVTDMVIHWTRQAVMKRQATASTEVTSPSVATSLLNRSIPTAIHARATRLYKTPSSCFNLESLGSRGTSNGQNLLTVPWHTASCQFLGAVPYHGTHQQQGLPCRASSLFECAQRDSIAAGCTHWDSIYRCSDGALSVVPPTWFYCANALSASRKESPGVVALKPGAQLYLPLDVSFAAASTASLLNIRLLHLTSYEGMGIAYLRCVAGCQCPMVRIDAHNVAKDGRRNESTFKEFSFQATTFPQSQGCLLGLHLSAESSSGGHKFKVRSVTARSVEQCETRDSPNVCSVGASGGVGLGEGFV